MEPMTHILIADADPRTRQALMLLLEHKLAVDRVGEAWDHASLVRQLAALKPDALLLDCHLPGLTRADMTALLDRSTSVRLALMSVNADDAALAQQLHATFVYKGALPEEALAVLRALISAERPGIANGST